MGCGPSKPTAAVVAASVPSTASTIASTARAFSNSPGYEATGLSQTQQQKQMPPPAGEPRRDLPSQDALANFDLSVDSDSNSVQSTHSVGDQSKKNPLSSFNSAPNLHEAKKGHERTGSKLGLVDDLKYGERKNPNLVRIEVPLGKPIEEVYEGVHDGQVLGSGVSGVVRRVTHRATQVEYAVKCLDLALIDSDAGLRQLKEEIYIMCQLDHPNIVRLEEVYESHSEIYLVQEVCKGGELFDRLDEQPDYRYTEAQCARLVKQMLSSVMYLHNKGIIHRDLKLENFLFRDVNADSELVMIDFGLSKHFTFGEVHHEAVGTPYTVAPEVIRGRYDERCDVWAIGVITYLLLSGEPPFGGCGGPETLLQVRDNILRGAFRFEPKEIWRPVSKEAKKFIEGLLVVDPLKRPTAQRAKESKWLKMCCNIKEDMTGGEDSTINPDVVKALVGFREYSDMRKLLCEVLSFTLLPEQIQGLRKEFEKYDKEGTGEISLSTLKNVLIGNASTGKLGGLTEAEVIDIFNAMRVRKGETTIHWHDFIAAGLSQCAVDDRNLRLAFGRLDQEHKGYISFENVMDLIGGDTFGNEDQMLQMWGETSLINYEDFVLLMKGQKKLDSGNLRSSLQGVQGLALAEILEDDEENGTPHGSFVLEESSPQLDSFLPELSPAVLGDSPNTIGGVYNSLSAPPTPLHYGKRFDEIDYSPLSVDDDAQHTVSFNEQCSEFKMTNFTPPQTPVRGPSDYVTPSGGREDFHPKLISRPCPPLPLPWSRALHASLMQDPETDYLTRPSLTRGRSVSLDEKDTLMEEAESRKSIMTKLDRDSRQAMIPEHATRISDIDRVAQDETKTPLVINRTLYRAHREFRLTLTEACKRFEDEQMRRAKETLRAKESAGAKYTASLVMRHGQALSDESIKKFLAETMEEQRKQVDQANRRGGRGRHSRKKTNSDMSGMLIGPTPPMMPEAGITETYREAMVQIKEDDEFMEKDDTVLRHPTIPGEFRTTSYDPFRLSLS